MAPQSTILAASAGAEAFRASCIAAAEALGVSHENAELGTDAAIVAGRGQYRVYHDVGHFRDLAAGSALMVAALKDPKRAVDSAYAERLGHLYTLVGRDHDAAYVAVDRGMSEAVEKNVSPYVEKTAQGVYKIRADAKGETIEIAMAAFGYTRGQELQPFNGQNEFLSTLHSLEVNKGIRPSDKVALAVMIQQTIPFMAADALAKTMERVRGLRLLDAAQERALAMAAVHFANRDVINFAQTRESFFENTIKLMREGGADFTSPANIADKSLRVAAFFTGLLADIEAGKKIVFRNAGSLLTPQELTALNDKSRMQIANCITDMKAFAMAADPATAVPLAPILKLDMSSVAPDEVARGKGLVAQALQWVNPGASWVDATKDSSLSANKHR